MNDISHRHQMAVEDYHKRDTWLPVLHVDFNESPKTELEPVGTHVKTRSVKYKNTSMCSTIMNNPFSYSLLGRLS